MARRGENIRKRKDGRWEGRYIKARTPEGKIQWGYVYGTAYAEVKRVLIQRKAEAGFYNLNQTDLTFEVLSEVWLCSLKNAIKESTYAHYSYTLHKGHAANHHAHRCGTQATGKLLCSGMPLDAATYLQICRSFTFDSSNGAGSCAAKSHRQNFCASLPGGTTATSSICTGEPHASQNRLTTGAGIGASNW